MFADDTVLYLGGSTVLTLSKGEQGALAPRQCGPGSNPGVDVICGLKLLLGFSSPLPQEVFFLVLRFFPLLKNQHFLILTRPGTHGHVSKSF